MIFQYLAKREPTKMSFLFTNFSVTSIRRSAVRSVTRLTTGILATGVLTSLAHADDISINQPTPSDINSQIDQTNVAQNELEKLNKQGSLAAQQIPTDANLPSEQDNQTRQMTKAESLAYLAQHPEELEFIVASNVRSGNADNLADLLPVYRQYPQRDPSLVQWGQAIIDADQGNLDVAVASYRELNAQFPNVKTLRFQMAMALLKNHQFNAAQSELEQLRTADEITNKDKDYLDKLLTAIKSRKEWSFYGNLSYVNNDNINDNPPEGTDLGRGFKAGKRVAGTGVNYALTANKRWPYDNNFFNSFSLGTYGTYYWDNKNYSDATVRASVGVGYLDNKKELELSTHLAKQFYGFGDKGDGDLHNYRTGKGIELQGRYRLDDKWRYNASLGYSRGDYVEEYKNNDNQDVSFSHGLTYTPTPITQLYAGMDVFVRDTDFDFNSFNRKGVRLGWGQVWPKGVATYANVGYGYRQYHGHDFFGDKRKNHEYTGSVSLWHRGLSFFNMTPKLVYSYKKVDSNAVREESQNQDVQLMLSTSF